MKSLRSFGCLSLYLSLNLFSAKAQSPGSVPAKEHGTSQKNFFDLLALTTSCSVDSLDKLFDARQYVSIVLAPGVLMWGKVVARVDHNASVKSVNIQLEDYPGTQLTLSRELTETGAVRYAGCIIKEGGREALLLTLDRGHYYFTKIDQRLLLSE